VQDRDVIPTPAFGHPAGLSSNISRRSPSSDTYQIDVSGTMASKETEQASAPFTHSTMRHGSEGKKGSGPSIHGKLRRIEPVKEPEDGTPGAVVQAVVTDFTEAAWQDVLQEATNQLVGLEAHGARLVGVAGAVPHDVASVPEPENGLLRKRYAVEVARKISQRLFPCSHRLGVHYPCACGRCAGAGGGQRPGPRVDLGEELGVLFFECVMQTGAEDP